MANSYQGFTNPTIVPDEKYGWQAASDSVGGVTQTIGDYLARRQDEVRKLHLGIALAQGQAQAEQQAKIDAQQQDPVYQLRMQMINKMNASGFGGNQSQPSVSGQAANFNPLNPVGGDNPSQYIMNPNFAFGGNEPFADNPAYKESIKPATMPQETTALYASRIEQANKIFDSLEKFTNNQNAGDMFQAGLPEFANFLKSEDMQSYQQAQRNFLNAILRRESGAVISPSEFKEGRQQYFPQPGDKPAVLAQKKANRDLVMQNFVKSSGKAFVPYAGVSGQSSSNASGAPTLDEINAELARRQSQVVK